MTRFNNNRSVLISKLPDQLSIASLNWTLNYINDPGGDANVKIKIFSQLVQSSPGCQEHPFRHGGCSVNTEDPQE